MTAAGESATAVQRTDEQPVNLDETFLPTGRMRQITRVCALAGETITGEVDLSRADWVFDDHFPDDPVFPGTLLVEAAGQLVAVWAWADGQRGHPRLVRSSARFTGEVGPDRKALRLEATVRERRRMNFGEVSVRDGEREVARVDLVLTVVGTA